jgi:hypothetical protein
MFFNHLAFDGLNTQVGSPWRLENAVLTDKNDRGEDLFEGHGAGPDTEKQMLRDLAQAYNAIAQQAVKMAQEVEDKVRPPQELQQKFPAVSKDDDKWVVTDPGRDDARRRGNKYELKTADEQSPEKEPLLPGLYDPIDRHKLNAVERPIESTKQSPPNLDVPHASPSGTP